MILSNLLRDSENGTPEFQNALTTLCILLAPMAPHFASEMWEHLREAARCLDTQMTKVRVNKFFFAEAHLHQLQLKYPDF